MCLDGGGCERYERVACETRWQGGDDDDGGDDGGRDIGPEAPLVSRGGDMSTESQTGGRHAEKYSQLASPSAKLTC